MSPLALPTSGCSMTRRRWSGVDAVALFCERARAHDPDFDVAGANPAVVAEICRRLDGLPLAIELTAARCGLLSAGEIAERLDTALGAPGAGPRDAPARQQTLRATIEWSHNLLSDDEKRCFARFAVFAGGATLDAAETVTGADLDTLDHLVAKNLLVRRRQAHAPTRLGMLETIRAYAIERLRLGRRRASRARGPLSLLPRTGPASRHRASALDQRRGGAPRLPRRRDRQPPLGTRLGHRPGQRRTRARAGIRARLLLDDA